MESAEISNSSPMVGSPEKDDTPAPKPIESKPTESKLTELKPTESRPTEYTPTSFWRFFWIRVRYHGLAVGLALVCALALMGVQIMFILNPSNVSVTDTYCTEFHTSDKQLARIITAGIIWLTTFIDFIIAWCFEAEEEVRLSGTRRKKMKKALAKLKSKFAGFFYEFRPMSCAGAKPEVTHKSDGPVVDKKTVVVHKIKSSDYFDFESPIEAFIKQSMKFENNGLPFMKKKKKDKHSELPCVQKLPKRPFFLPKMPLNHQVSSKQGKP